MKVFQVNYDASMVNDVTSERGIIQWESKEQLTIWIEKEKEYLDILEGN